MPMRWSVRVALGATLGALTTLAVALLTGGWVAAALAGGAVAALGFLGSFFLWSADIPPSRTHPGYEQVLFDRPNNLATLALALAMTGLAFGATLLGGGAPPAEDAPPAHAEYLANQTTLASDLQALHDAFVASLDAYDAGNLTAAGFRDALAADTEAAKALDDAAVALAAPPAHERAARELRNATRFLWESMVLMDACLGGSAEECEVMTLSLADAQTALLRYERLAPPAAASS